MDQLILKADINQCEFSGQINTGEVEARTLTVEMCDRLCSCAMAFVTFELADGTMYESKVTDGKAKVPLFEKSQFIKVGLYSADIEGNKCVKRYSPKPANTYVYVGSYNEGSTEPPIPTPGDYAELMGQIAEVQKDTAESLAALEKGTIKVFNEKVNLWELKTGIYYLNGGFKYKTDLMVTGTGEHIFIIYKPVPSKNAVRYIHFCGDYRKDVWSSIECGYTDGTTLKEYKIIDSSEVANDISGENMNFYIPNASAVKDYVKNYVKEQLGVIDNGLY